MTTKKKQAYRVLAEGLNYPVGKDEKRAERGDEVTDLPAKSIPWLLKDGHIEPAKEKD